MQITCEELTGGVVILRVQGKIRTGGDMQCLRSRARQEISKGARLVFDDHSGVRYLATAPLVQSVEDLFEATELPVLVLAK